MRDEGQAAYTSKHTTRQSCEFDAQLVHGLPRGFAWPFLKPVQACIQRKRQCCAAAAHASHTGASACKRKNWMVRVPSVQGGVGRTFEEDVGSGSIDRPVPVPLCQANLFEVRLGKCCQSRQHDSLVHIRHYVLHANGPLSRSDGRPRVPRPCSPEKWRRMSDR